MTSLYTPTGNPVTASRGQSAAIRAELALIKTAFDSLGTLGGSGELTLALSPTFSFATASQALFTDASKRVVSNAITGTGNVVMSASPTLTGTAIVAAVTASGVITANGGVTGNVTGNLSGTATNATNVTGGTVTGTTGSFSGVVVFSASPTVPTPTTAAQAASKGYVDGVAMGSVAIAMTMVRSARTSNTILAGADSTKLIDITTGGFTQTFTAAATLGSGWYCYLRNSATSLVELDLSGTSGGSNLVDTNAFTVAGPPSDMIVNGGFGADTDWTKGTNWTIAGGVGVATVVGGSNALQPAAALTVVVGHTYYVTYDLTVAAGNFQVLVGGTAGTTRSSSASFTETIVAADTTNLLLRRQGSNLTGTVDNVTCKDLSGRWLYQDADLAVNGGFSADTDWTKGGGWTIAGGVAVATATGNTLTPSAATFLTAGHLYSVTYDLVVTSGSVRVQLGGSNGYIHGVSGTYCDVLYAVDTTKPAFDGVTSFTGTLDNVVIRDLSSGTDQGFGIATFAGDTTASAVQTIAALTAGATYKLTYTVGVGTGGVAPYIGTQQLPRRYVSGTYTEYIVASAAHTTMGFYCNSIDVPFNGSVSAVSLVRCSDQVLLPGEFVIAESDASVIRVARLDETGQLARIANDSVVAAMTSGSWTTATLNTVVEDAHGFTALNTSNQLVLPAGRYSVDGAVYMSEANSIARLYNSTAGAALLHSTTSSNGGLQSLSGDFTLTAQSTLVLQINGGGGVNDGVAITTTSDRPFYRNTMLSIRKRG